MAAVINTQLGTYYHNEPLFKFGVKILRAKSKDSKYAINLINALTRCQFKSKTFAFNL